ncbi:venom allergen 5 2-like [Leptidea sinapis]|uniref:SCP domain-containing protein n=1 Tax=Leptidea sinapis TaxID=189913 RepID=A0A5E4QV46_9NEOP|nr:venom allergen 5 2-like [Leptidea sinapis]VVD01845.1 unnamed protein product [Leptidea sinapis]
MNFRVLILLTLCSLVKCLNGLSCEQIKAFVDGHNERRLQLARGEVPNQPAAALMKSVVWDAELAAKAQKWASNHKFSHNPNRTVGSKRFFTGENIYWSASTDKTFILDPNSAMESWFNEYKDYKYRPLEISDFQSKKMIGHYTQMVWSDSVYIGCGISKIEKNGFLNYYVVCNYGPAGNYLGQPPYVEGYPSKKVICGTSDCSRPYGDSC